MREKVAALLLKKPLIPAEIDVGGGATFLPKLALFPLSSIRRLKLEAAVAEAELFSRLASGEPGKVNIVLVGLEAVVEELRRDKGLEPAGSKERDLLLFVN
jgi:hypothetical protein